MELALLTAILIVLIVSVTALILMGNGTSEESARQKHKPNEYSLSKVRLAIERNTYPIARARPPPKRKPKYNKFNILKGLNFYQSFFLLNNLDIK
jgi:hypothetical protein